MTTPVSNTKFTFDSIKDTFASLEVRIPLEMAKLTSRIVSAANDIFELIKNVRPPVVLLEAKKVAIIPLFAIPLILFAFFENMIQVGQAIKSGCSEALAHAALLATATFGDIVEIPAKIGGVVNLFQPVSQIGVWAPSLFAASAILSVAGLIHSALTLTHTKTRDFITELKEKSQNAILNEIFTKPRFSQLSKKLKSMGSNANKALNKEFFKALKAITRTHSQKELQETIAKFSHEIRNLSLEDWRLLEEVGDMAYLNCLEDIAKKDASILSGHFQVDNQKLSSAIEIIKNCNDPKRKFDAVRTLKSRVSYKLLSDKLTIGANTVSIVSSVLFVIIAFVAAASPAAPFAYAILIGLTIYGIAKMIVDYQKKKTFEKVLENNFALSSPNQRSVRNANRFSTAL